MDDSSSETYSLDLKIKDARYKRSMHRVTALCFTLMTIAMTIDVVLRQGDGAGHVIMCACLSMAYWTFAYCESCDLAKATKDLARLKQ